VTEYPLLLRRARAAELVGVSPNTFSRLLRTGQIPPDCVFIDADTGTRRYRRDPLIAWAATNERQTA
jgi:predicted site-specific integrase-resolvase